MILLSFQSYDSVAMSRLQGFRYKNQGGLEISQYAIKLDDIE
jgi:hypothetical protein